MPWWAWLLVALTATAIVAGMVFRSHLRFAGRLAKSLATDERLPRPLRWCLGVALAIKVVPFPDFGIDEIILAVIAVLLLTVYRPTFRAIVAETREAETRRSGMSD
jgi:membrane protein implicated in regulation of membrane protease activity